MDAKLGTKIYPKMHTKMDPQMDAQMGPKMSAEIDAKTGTPNGPQNELEKTTLNCSPNGVFDLVRPWPPPLPNLPPRALCVLNTNFSTRS